MGFLAQQDRGKPILSSTIASELNIPHNYLSKILNQLAHAGLILTIRGRGGGVMLSCPGSDIILYEVVNLFITIDDYKQSLLELRDCDGNCGVHLRLRLRIITEQIEKMLNETTIAQVF